MYSISATTYNKETTTVCVMDEELMHFVIGRFSKCIDVATIVVCDNLTGEVLYEINPKH